MFRENCICLIALAVLCACAQISGAAAGDLLMESGADEYKTLTTGESWDGWGIDGGSTNARSNRNPRSRKE